MEMDEHEKKPEQKQRVLGCREFEFLLSTEVKKFSDEVDRDKTNISTKSEELAGTKAEQKMRIEGVSPGKSYYRLCLSTVHFTFLSSLLIGYILNSRS